MRKGFTLIELIVVIIVIGILSTVAIPQYMKATEKARAGKAIHALGLIGQAEKLYRAEMDKYINVSDENWSSSDLTNYVELGMLGGDADWNYSVVNASADEFDAIAKKLGGGAAYTGKTITLDENSTWGGDHPFNITAKK